MVRHVILWQLKDEWNDEERAAIKADIKAGLEGLKGKVPGIAEIKVYTEGLASSNADLMLDSVFETQEALQGYTVHPAHVEVANTFVRPKVKSRVCMDFEI